MQWNKDFGWLTQAAVTAWVCSCSLIYISRSGTHGFSSATWLSNVATSRQLCTHEQIQDHHSTSLLKQRYQKPLIQSIPCHDISSNIWYFHVLYRVSTSWPYCHFELTVGSYVSVRSQYMGNLDSDREVARGVAESKSSFLSDLKTFHALYVSMNAQRKTT